jgi:hypothetical protein
VLTLPAGSICDRLPRRDVLLFCRSLNALTSALPLLGFITPYPITWLLISAAIGGTLHSFDLPASRSQLGDVTDEKDIFPMVTLNNAGSHFSALVGPLISFVLGPIGLVVSMVLLAIASVLTCLIPEGDHRHIKAAELPPVHKAGTKGLKSFVIAAPSVSWLLLFNAQPGLVDKAVALVLPTVSQGAAVGIALTAPEVGAILAGIALSFTSIRCGIPVIAGFAVCYLAFVGLALGYSYEAEILVLGLGLAGSAKLAFNSFSQAKLQEIVPPDLRGRVFSF